MPNNIGNIIDKLRRAKQRLAEERPNQVLTIALDSIALVKTRIQSSGTDSSGSQFAGYVPSYEKKKRESGFQTDFFDFTVRGRGWANIIPKVVEDGNGKTSVEISGGNQLTRNKLLGQVKKRGNILLNSQDEIDAIRNVCFQWNTSIINQELST